MCESKDSNSYDSENGYTYEKCNSCKSIFLNPRPTEEERSRAVSYGMHPGTKTLNTTPPFSQNKVKVYLKCISDLKLSHHLKKGTKHLDIGAGNGEFIKAFNQFIPSDSVAIEPNTQKQVTLNTMGINIKEELNDCSDLDFISMLNVFSHLSKPRQTLGKIYAILKPNGYMILQTGDTSLCEPDQHYKPYLAPDHLLFTHKEKLVNLMEELGFSIISTQSYPSPYIKAWIKSIAKWILGRIPWANLRYANMHSDLWILAKKNA